MQHLLRCLRHPFSVSNYDANIVCYHVFSNGFVRKNVREKERKEMLDNVQSGSRVLLTSGIIGQVTNVKENTVVIQSWKIQK